MPLTYDVKLVVQLNACHCPLITGLESAGLAAEKPTNRRRRGGRNRNKAALAGDPVAPDRPAADESAVQDVADSMAQMQMERLASNGTAGCCQLPFNHVC